MKDGEIVNPVLSVKELADLKGCSPQWIRKLAGEQKLQGQKRLNADGSPEWVFPLKSLEPHLQLRYYKNKAAEMPGLAEFTKSLQNEGRPFDHFSEEEREEIIWWQKTLEDWKEYRNRYPGSKAEADDKFIALCAKTDPENTFSVDTLYRKERNFRKLGLDGLLDKRGKGHKGKSKITEEMWQTFLSYYLDEAQHPIQKCYEYTRLYFQDTAPELVADIPTYSTFWRRVQNDIPEPMEVLGRQGQKAFRDRCAPYIHRLYEEMASNVLQYASVFQSELDKAAVEQATSGWMELNSKLVKYESGSEVKIPQLDMDGLADYDRQTGFVEGAINLTWQTKQMTMDRGRQFTFDEQEVNDTNFVLTASTVMGEFQRTKVVPEIDAYRYSRLAALAIEKGRAVYGYTPEEATVLKQLYADIAAIQDEVGDDTPLVITMATPVAALFDLNTSLSRSISVTDFQQGGINLKVKSINGQHPIIRAGSGRLKTAYQFHDGTTADQQKGGFAPAEGAQDINWIICPRTAAIAVSRTDKVRIFDPETFQKKRAWAVDYRKYHDLWVLENKMNTIRVNIRQAKA